MSSSLISQRNRFPKDQYPDLSSTKAAGSPLEAPRLWGGRHPQARPFQPLTPPRRAIQSKAVRRTPWQAQPHPSHPFRASEGPRLCTRALGLRLL